MSAAETAAPPNAEMRRELLAELAESYPRDVALGLLPLCGPRCGGHAGRACAAPGKRPADARWQAAAAARWADADADAEECRARIADHVARGGNVGWCPPAGVLVLDADTPDSVALLERALPDAPTQDTARGAHYVVRVPADVELRARAGVEIAPGVRVDLRPGLRAQVVVAPSIHATGAEYTWRRSLPADLAELPELPPALLAALAGSAAGGDDGPHASGGEIPAGRRNETLFRVGAAMRGRGEAHDAILTELRAVNSDRCRPPLADDEVRSVAASAGRLPEGGRVVLAGEPEDRSASPHSDVANAMRLRAHYGADLRWAAGIGWIAWTGAHWAADDLRARGVAQQLGRIIQREAAAILSGAMPPPAGLGAAEAAEERLRWARASEMATRTTAALAEARALLATDGDMLDADPMLLGVTNGTLDLRTGALLPHRRDDWITRLAPVAVDPAAEAPEFAAFVAAITSGSAPLAAWLQRWCGYCLTGDVSEQVFAFFHGGGANGKSAFASILEAVLGPYCVRAMPDLLTAAAGERHATELADLRGARVALCSEIERGRHWAESRIKQLTGEARITARRMRMDPITFRSTAKLVVLANTKPVVQDGGDSFWRRCRLVPFGARFLGADADPELPARIIASEKPGVLNWMVAGLAAWREHRLGQAPEIEEAVNQYRGESAEVATFLAACCDRGDDYRVRAGELWAAYRAWAGERGATVHGREFAVAVAEAGCRRVRVRGYEHWAGVRLAPEGAEGVGKGRGDPV